MPCIAIELRWKTLEPQIDADERGLRKCELTLRSSAIVNLLWRHDWRGGNDELAGGQRTDLFRGLHVRIVRQSRHDYADRFAIPAGHVFVVRRVVHCLAVERFDRDGLIGLGKTV